MCIRDSLTTQWGICSIEEVEIKFWAYKDGDKWRACLTDIIGHYSIQIRDLGEKNVTGPGGNTDEENFCPQVASLALNSSVGPTSRWYTEEAIRAHEDVHKAHLLPALQAVNSSIESEAVEKLVVDDYGQNSAQAKSSIVANALPGVLDEAFELWQAEFRTRWDPADHGANFDGPAYTAEHSVTQSMILDICGEANAQSWEDCTSCPPS